MPEDVRAGSLVRAAVTALAGAGVAAPRTDAELLLAHAWAREVADVRRAAILGEPVPGAVASAYDGLVARRAGREPLQHLTGTAPFRHLELAVGPGVFVPRPETEVVAQVAIDAAQEAVAAGRTPVVVDLCTGSGAIALAVATEVPGAVVHAVELDADAHTWARRNVERVGTTSGAPGAPPLVHLVRGDARTALTALDGTCDVVVSNPPYVPSDAVPVDPEVARHDPAVALYGLGPDGLEVPRGVARAALRLLRDGGTFVMEHAEVQAASARALVEGTRTPAGDAFTDVRTLPDLTGRPRMVVARRGRIAL
ncbi:peptide chain release factor N(5)-glutamine methyltransferase [Luteimicrobium subarcticum]|uniref:peptide chain release factor N(5)-glutamine methyltransferase n=1 Tax=Luteimicrobium subarcticum TaxID=620910 RepID=A0A2M8W1I0_9MICO|nr:peptide chain release factor N(5)-glutamine methyltransferase [Luteimicrobium subarcticum]PJI84792.1 release factor glutamine methyltransferase [Luteimicrobium subarcticum]